MSYSLGGIIVCSIYTVFVYIYGIRPILNLCSTSKVNDYSLHSNLMEQHTFHKDDQRSGKRCKSYG